MPVTKGNRNPTTTGLYYCLEYFHLQTKDPIIFRVEERTHSGFAKPVPNHLDFKQTPKVILIVINLWQSLIL